MVNNKDEVFFFSDSGEKSQRARKFLEENGVPFLEFRKGKDYEIDADDPIFPPTVMGQYGQFMGIKAVERYIGLWNADPRRRG